MGVVERAGAERERNGEEQEADGDRDRRDRATDPPRASRSATAEPTPGPGDYDPKIETWDLEHGLADFGLGPRFAEPREEESEPSQPLTTDSVRLTGRTGVGAAGRRTSRAGSLRTSTSTSAAAPEGGRRDADDLGDAAELARIPSVLLTREQRLQLRVRKAYNDADTLRRELLEAETKARRDIDALREQLRSTREKLADARAVADGAAATLAGTFPAGPSG